MARANYSLRAIDFMGGGDLYRVVNRRRESKYFAHHSPAARMAFSRRACRDFGYLSRLHSQMRAFHRIRRARFFGFARLLEFVRPGFTTILVYPGIFDGLFDRFDRRIQPEF